MVVQKVLGTWDAKWIIGLMKILDFGLVDGIQFLDYSQ
jgi:hypothetical protein